MSQSILCNYFKVCTKYTLEGAEWLRETDRQTERQTETEKQRFDLVWFGLILLTLFSQRWKCRHKDRLSGLPYKSTFIMEKLWWKQNKWLQYIYNYIHSSVRTSCALCRQTGRQADRQTHRHRHRQADRQTGRQADRQTGRETEWQTDRKRETEVEFYFILLRTFIRYFQATLCQWKG